MVDWKPGTTANSKLWRLCRSLMKQSENQEQVKHRLRLNEVIKNRCGNPVRWLTRSMKLWVHLVDRRWRDKCLLKIKPAFSSEVMFNHFNSNHLTGHEPLYCSSPPELWRLLLSLNSVFLVPVLLHPAVSQVVWRCCPLVVHIRNDFSTFNTVL